MSSVLLSSRRRQLQLPDEDELRMCTYKKQEVQLVNKRPRLLGEHLLQFPLRSCPQTAAEMSKIEMLRLLINQRLTAAAEEIFGVFGRTIAEYEEEISRSKLEIDRQRRLLDLSRKPQVSLQVTGTGR